MYNLVEQPYGLPHLEYTHPTMDAMNASYQPPIYEQNHYNPSANNSPYEQVYADSGRSEQGASANYDSSVHPQTQTSPIPGLSFGTSSAASPHAESTPASTAPPSTPPAGPAHKLPNTYQGRRSAEARQEYPWMCSGCGKLYLYENSAKKHVIKKHGLFEEVVKLYDAPKRPQPGCPRNKKAAKSQARRSVTPSVTASHYPSPTPGTTTESPTVHYPQLTYVLDGQPITDDVAQQAGLPLSPAQAASQLTSVDSGNTFGTNAVDNSQTDFAGVIDPALLQDPSNQASTYAYYQVPPSGITQNGVTLDQSQTQTQARAPSTILEQPQPRPSSTLADQRPLPAFRPYDEAETAQHAITIIRRDTGYTGPITAEEAIRYIRRKYPPLG